jgi:hypothetical protein
MNWRLVLTLGIIFGLLMGVGGLMGPPAWVIRWTLISAVAISAFFISRAGEKVFANGFFTGLLIGLLQAGLSLVLWNQFITHNPQVFDGLHRSSGWLRIIAIIALIPWSIFLGLLIGLFSWFFYRLLSLRKHPRATVGND